MTKYAFFSIPAYGHLLPTLPLVTGLIAHGEQVIYYIRDEHQATVEAAGASWHDFPTVNAMTVEEEECMLGEIMDSLRAEQTDFIVYDFFFIWGGLLARALQIPAINVRSTYANNKHFTMSAIHQHASPIWSSQDSEQSTAAFNIQGIYAQFERFSEILKVPTPAMADPYDVFVANEALNIYMIPRLFQPHAETFDERHLFVGSSILRRPDQQGFPFEALDGRPLLYIALGTLFNNRADIFKTCIQAFGDSEWQVVLSRGSHSAPFALGPVPTNFLVVNYAPQLEILKQATLFVSHGGMNSMIESIMAGVPAIFIPQIAEQAINAENGEKLGVGLALNPKTVTVDQLNDAVARITQERARYDENIQTVLRSIQSEGGYKRAVEAILSLQATRTVSPTSA